MTRAARAFAAWLVFAAFGCQGSGPLRAETPAELIAFIYHPEDEARQRAEARAKRTAPRAPEIGAPPSVLHLNSFRDYLEAAVGGRADGGFAGRLALLDPRSGGISLLESAQRGAIPLAWSPRRDRLLFAQRDFGTLQLFEFDSETQSVSPMTAGPNHHPQGCYGPEGRLVVVVAERAAATEEPGAAAALVSRIALIGPGNAVEPISPGPMDGDPSCSPDGSAVAYVRFFAGTNSEIWLHAFLDDERARALAPGREPAFSPDGEWIVYSRVDRSKAALWRIRRDGSGRTRLGRGSGSQEYGPAVSPDGSLVVYESVFDNRHRLFVRRFDGTGDSVLFSDGDGTHAVW